MINWVEEMVKLIEDWVWTLEEYFSLKSVSVESFLKDNYITVLIVIVALFILYKTLSLLKYYADMDLIRRWNEREDKALSQYREKVEEGITPVKPKIKKKPYRWDLPRDQAQKLWNEDKGEDQG